MRCLCILFIATQFNDCAQSRTYIGESKICSGYGAFLRVAEVEKGDFLGEYTGEIVFPGFEDLSECVTSSLL